MTQQGLSKSVSPVRSLFIVLLILGGSAVGAVGEIAMAVEPIAGFSGYFRSGEWAPVTLSVQNLGSRFEGNVDLTIRWGERFSKSTNELTYRREVSILGGATHLLPFVLPMNNAALPLKVSFQDQSDEASYEVTVRSRPVRGDLVVALSRRPDLDFLLRPRGEGTGRTVAYPLPGYLPEDSLAYGGVAAVVIHDADLSVLSRAQRTAISNYVAVGGTVIVSGGPALLAAVPGPIQDLLPVTIGDLQTVQGSQGLVQLPASVRLPVIASEAVRGTTLARSGETPLVVEAALGNGRIFFLAFDYATLRKLAPETALDLFDSLLSSGTDYPPSPPIELRRRIFETPVLADLLDLPLYRFPSFVTVPALVLTYAATFVMLFALGGKDGRWLFLPLVFSALFGTGAYFWLNVRQQPSAALFMEYDHIRTVPGQPVAHIEKDLIVFSTQNDRYEIGLTSGTVIPLEDRDLSLFLGDDVTIWDIEVPRWSLRNYHAHGYVALPIRAQAEMRSGELQIVVANPSSRRIEGVVAVYQGTSVALGDLAPGERTSVEFVPEPASVERLHEPDGDLQTRARATAVGLEVRRQLSSPTPGVTIIGFLPESPLPATPNRSFARRFRLSVVTQHLEMDR